MSSRKIRLRLTFSFFLFLALASSGNAGPVQADTSRLIIDNILIIGNKKTKDKIILRELDFKSGDTLLKESLSNLLTKSRNRIFNTNLFITVDLNLIDRSANHKDLLIHVKERWYIYPIPIFELADRNFNEWWQQRDRDPERINLGIFYTQRNMRGRNETLRAKVQLGFTKKFELFYTIPYLNKNQRAGLNFDISYILNKQIPYKTSDHRLIYFDGNQYIRTKFRSGFLFTYRKKFYRTHAAGLSYYHNAIDDTIAGINPSYFLDGHTRQRYFTLRYAFINDLRDITYYPLKGNYFRVEIEKTGLGIFNDINQLQLTGEYLFFKPLYKKIYFAGGVKQKLSFPATQPYHNVRGLGYERDYVSGYELYVIDGRHFSLLKANLKYQLFSTRKEVSSIPMDEFGTIPFSIYFRIYSDLGYVDNYRNNFENRTLTNELLWGGGAGLDLVSYYDLVFRIEYSFNRSGGHGFFLHFKSAL